MSVGNNIKKLRLEKGLTQKGLGEKCGMADSAIRRYENGPLVPKLSTLNKIASSLEVPLTALLDSNDVIELERQTPKSLVVNAKIQGSIQEIENIVAIANAIDKLNYKGQKQAIEQVEMLGKIPEFQKTKLYQRPAMSNPFEDS